MAIAVIELMIIAFIPSPISANVYLGGYSSNSQCYDTEHVIMNCTIPPGVTIPSGNFLAGVLSVAGVKDGGLSGWVYQIGIARVDTGELYWSAQSWDMSDQYDFEEGPLPDAGSWVAIFLRMDMGEFTSSYRNRCWGYKNDTAHLSFYREAFVGMHSGEDYFRVGTYNRLGRIYKHFQFGVEGVTGITNYTWYCYEWRTLYYYDGLWRYQPAKVAHGEDSWITRRGLWGEARIAGDNYDGVNKLYSGYGVVVWEYTGTTIPNGVALWSNSGYVGTTSPSEPFEI